MSHTSIYARVPSPTPTNDVVGDLNVEFVTSDLEDACMKQVSGRVICGGQEVTSSVRIPYEALCRYGTSSATAIDEWRDSVQTALRENLWKYIGEATTAGTLTAIASTSASTFASCAVTNCTVTNSAFSDPYRWGVDIGTTDYTYNPYTTGCNIGGWELAKPDKKTEFLEKMRNNLQIRIPRRGALVAGIAANEARAVSTLREDLSETEFRKYIKYGFVLVPGKSGKTYQVFRNQDHTKVWKGGKLLEEICVRIANSKCPPTDNVVAFKTMIEADEEYFRKCGNVYKNTNGCMERVRAA